MQEAEARSPMGPRDFLSLGEMRKTGKIRSRNKGRKSKVCRRLRAPWRRCRAWPASVCAGHCPTEKEGRLGRGPVPIIYGCVT